MTLLTKLGLLGLLGIVALIIIYIIKPNFQQKFVSSTFIWKLSLKRKKKKVPISKLRNLLIIICQILIITACAAILSTPAKIIKQKVENEEVIIVIDSSASMRTTYEEYTRFERAVEKAIERANQAFDNHGIVSVIIADDSPAFLAERITEEGRTALIDELIELGLDAADACYYGSSDLDAAVILAAPLVENNPSAKLAVYTDTAYHYVNAELMTVVNVAHEDEWNAAILGATAEFNDGSYNFEVDVATYGVDLPLTVTVQVVGANRGYASSTGIASYTFTQELRCVSGTPQTIVFTNDSTLESTDEVIYCVIDDLQRVFSFDQVSVKISHERGQDSFQEDDFFYIYGGEKPIIRVQYASSMSNNFFNAMLMVLKNTYRGDWDIRITEVNRKEAALEGFDLYIFEHTMPRTLPEDGVVILINPDIAPSGADFRIGRVVELRQSQFWSNAARDHAVMNNLNVEGITVSQYTKLASFSNEYQVLATCAGEPMVLVRNEGDRQTVIMPFSVHYSNISVKPDFMLMFMNLFNYYFPKTVQQNAFEIGSPIPVDSRGEFLDVLYPGSEQDDAQTIVDLPNTLIASLPGPYILQQRTYFGKDLTEKIYVRIPSQESNIKMEADSLANIYVDHSMDQFYEDLLFWLALALVSLLFIEWFLHSRENI